MILFIETTTVNKKGRKETKKLKVDMHKGVGILDSKEITLHTGHISINGNKFVVKVLELTSGEKEVSILTN